MWEFYNATQFKLHHILKNLYYLKIQNNFIFNNINNKITNYIKYKNNIKILVLNILI